MLKQWVHVLEEFDGGKSIIACTRKEDDTMFQISEDKFEVEVITKLCEIVHKANAKWWVHLETGEPLNRNVGELLMLTTSELAEAMEGHRKNLMDDKLPHRKMFEVELADALIRILDMGAGLGLDLGGAFKEKMEFNAIRKDHQFEARKAIHGKKY